MFSLVYSDAWWPTVIISSGFKYFASFIDLDLFVEKWSSSYFDYQIYQNISKLGAKSIQYKFWDHEMW